MSQGKCKKREQVNDYIVIKKNNRKELLAFCGSYTKVLAFVRPGEVLVKNEYGRIHVYNNQQFDDHFERVIE